MEHDVTFVCVCMQLQRYVTVITWFLCKIFFNSNFELYIVSGSAPLPVKISGYAPVSHHPVL